MAVAPSAKVVSPRRAGGTVPRPSTWGGARRGRCPRRLNRSPDAGPAKRRGRSPSGPYAAAGDGRLAESVESTRALVAAGEAATSTTEFAGRGARRGTRLPRYAGGSSATVGCSCRHETGARAVAPLDNGRRLRR